MTYLKAYKELEKANVIDSIILELCKDESNLLTVKYDIIQGIQYYIDFTKSSTFEGMKYWQDLRFVNTEAEKQHHKIVNKICKSLAEIEISENEKQIEALQYLISSQR